MLGDNRHILNKFMYFCMKLPIVFPLASEGTYRLRRNPPENGINLPIFVEVEDVW